MASFVYNTVILAELLRSIRSRNGLVVLTGAAGTGKTTLLLGLGDRLVQESIEFGLIQNPRLSRKQFCESLAYDLNLPCRDLSKEEVLRCLFKLLREQADKGSTTVLLIDDAQDLDQEILSDIRLLEKHGGQHGDYVAGTA